MSGYYGSSGGTQPGPGQPGQPQPGGWQQGPWQQPGQPQPGGWQQPGQPQPPGSAPWQPMGMPYYAPPKKSGHGCLIAFLVVAVIGILLVGGCTFVVVTTLGPGLSKSMEIQNADSRIASVTYQWNNGEAKFVIRLAAGVPDSDAEDIACNVVRPALAGSQFENTDFAIYSSSGRFLANQSTPCT